MRKQQIDIAVIVTADDHQSEYVHEHFKFRQYVSGFTGSAGTLVITEKEAGLWTDGRYFLQADEQLAGTGITLYKMGEEGVCTWTEFVAAHLKKGDVLYVDGRTISKTQGVQLADICRKTEARLLCHLSMADDVWKERPPLTFSPVYMLPDDLCKETGKEKLTRLRRWMQANGSVRHLIASLDDVAWLFNLRGSDIAYSPLFLAYASVGQEDAILYMSPDALDKRTAHKLAAWGVAIRPYKEIYNDVASLSGVVSYDPSKVNYTLYDTFMKSGKVEALEAAEPVMLMKCVKNEAELSGIRLAHEKDGAAFVRFLCWLDEHRSEPLTEIALSDKLEQFRKEQPGYMYPSFAPISGYREHGAIVHYSATEKSDMAVKGDGLLLLDTGSHFDTGSTDITRTIGFGDLSLTEKEHYTLVLRSMLRLAFARFHSKASFTALDYAARGVLWQEGLNFNHGTGHGVGHLGTIHEPPVGFRMQADGSMPAPAPGMVITDEPGVYIAGSHGVRLENELLITRWKKNEWGEFFCFETLTLVPFDKRCILPGRMQPDEIRWLNTYHRMVWDRISPLVPDKERQWLQEACAPLPDGE